MKKIAFITGCTSGIGSAVAERFSRDGFNLIITGRRADRLQELANALEQSQAKTGSPIKILTLCFDVRDKSQVEAAVSSIPEEWQDIDVLINNAGLAVGLNPVQDGVIDDWERMIDTNVKGLLYISRAIIPFMIKRKKGHVVNLGSIAGKEAYPNGNVYCATKHAVDALSKGMRQDLLPHGIRVTQICPGAVETEFSLVRFKGDNIKADNVYKGFKPLSGEDIANAISYCINLPEHVNINDMIIMPTAQANSSLFNKVL